jgi:hypothetical protein
MDLPPHDTPADADGDVVDFTGPRGSLRTIDLRARARLQASADPAIANLYRMKEADRLNEHDKDMLAQHERKALEDQAPLLSTIYRPPLKPTDIYNDFDIFPRPFPHAVSDQISLISGQK